MTVLRSIFTSVPLAIAQIRQGEPDLVGAAGSFCQLVRSSFGYLIAGSADPEWILFAISQGVSVVGDLAAGAIQISRR
jgi:hypothetical protein